MSEVIKVKIGQFPGKIKVVEINQGCTLSAVMEKAGLSSEGYQVRINNKEVKDGDPPVNNGDTILMVKAISGN